MLDVNLHGQESFPVADALVERGIPFVFTTGFGASTLPERFKRTPVMERPFRLKDIRRAISELQTPSSLERLTSASSLCLHSSVALLRCS